VIRAGVAALVAAFALAVAHAAEPVAFVADLRGAATVEGDGKVGFLAELPAGTRLLLGTGARVVVTYAATGAEFTLNGPGEFSVEATEVRAAKGAQPAKRMVQALADPGVVARTARTATASLRMRGVRPEGPKTALEYPVDAPVATLQPVLRWRGDPNAGAFTVTLTDSAGTPLWKGTTPSTNVKAGVKLAPARGYRWTVATAQGPVGEARFETLPAEAIALADRSRAGAKTFSQRIMHAFVLAGVGASQDARQAWAELARERPDLPELAALAR